MTIKEYDSGLLHNNAHSKFTNHGWTTANIRGTTAIKMKANFGSVILSGNNWEFEDDTIFASDLDLINRDDIDESLITTIVGSYNNEKYSIELAKITRNKHERLRIMSVNKIPELSSTSLITGLFMLFVTNLKRKFRK